MVAFLFSFACRYWHLFIIIYYAEAFRHYVASTKIREEARSIDIIYADIYAAVFIARRCCYYHFFRDGESLMVPRPSRFPSHSFAASIKALSLISSFRAPLRH